MSNPKKKPAPKKPEPPGLYDLCALTRQELALARREIKALRKMLLPMNAYLITIR